MQAGKFETERFAVRSFGAKGFLLRDKRSHRTKGYWDAANLYTDEYGTPTLQRVAQEKLGYGKLEDVDRKKLGSQRGYYPNHRARVIEYCLRDSRLAKELFDLRVSLLGRALNYYPARWSSKASIVKARLEHDHPEWYAYRWGRHSSVFQAKAKQAFKGGIFALFVLGRTENSSQIDLNGAYPAAIRFLPRLDRLHAATFPSVVDSRTYHHEALLGVYEIDIDYDGFMPLPMGDGKRILYPDSDGRPRPYLRRSPSWITSSGQDAPFGSARPANGSVRSSRRFPRPSGNTPNERPRPPRPTRLGCGKSSATPAMGSLRNKSMGRPALPRGFTPPPSRGRPERGFGRWPTVSGGRTLSP